jgi:carbamoyl-phosphate synthase small subunit
MKKDSMKLVLEDGTEIKGQSFGYEGSIAGEVVFNTAMVGYTESLTDPSYAGQILVLTYPLIGNYGIPGYEIKDGLPAFHESNRIHIAGLVVSSYVHEHSHWNAGKSLSDWLIENNIPAITGVDTRVLTKYLRNKGTVNGKIVMGYADVDWFNLKDTNIVEKVSINKTQEYGTGKQKIILVDCGVKNNIIRNLVKRDATVKVVPWNYDFNKEEYDGLFISNGPGDPIKCETTINNLRQALQREKPIYGICLGNQLLALAAGASTYKLKYGHRSHNQPVLKVDTDTCYITSQNHGYAIDANSLPDNWEVLFKNLNDDTVEGIKHKTKPFFSSQFHPEAAGGPTDTEFLFDEFMQYVREYKN